MKKFLRRDAVRFGKFSKGKGKKAKWRSPKGRDNKMREKIRGYPKVVSIGYSKERGSRDKIENLIPMKVTNLNELENAGKENIIILGKIGKKKKILILEKAKEKGIKVYKTNLEKKIEKLKGEKKKENEPKKI